MLYRINTYTIMKPTDNPFLIQSNHTKIDRGSLLIAEPFLQGDIFERSVILITDHDESGSMGLILNTPLPHPYPKAIADFCHTFQSDIYLGGPVATDTLFYIHTIEGIRNAMPLYDGLYMNGDYEDILNYLQSGAPIKGKIRFFLGYSGWNANQLKQEIAENTWLISKEPTDFIMDENNTKQLWAQCLKNMGSKYEVWSLFPIDPTLN